METVMSFLGQYYLPYCVGAFTGGYLMFKLMTAIEIEDWMQAEHDMKKTESHRELSDLSLCKCGIIVNQKYLEENGCCEYCIANDKVN